ncbi:MAG TPA: alkaline phosphatase D family protein [Planctomycetaceae bacterium]|nr:alkaline phosphatase D family protein [Planctomycetaceae bacterium]
MNLKNLRAWLAVLVIGGSAVAGPRPTSAAHLGMGLRVGEVTQDSAIVWTRVTKNATRNTEGYRDPAKREPKQDEYVPSPVKIADREGAMPGAPGQVRVVYWRSDVQSGREKASAWADVTAERDFTHQFRLTGLDAAAAYSLRVECRADGSAPVTGTAGGEFTTPHPEDRWQDVTFTVITGQAYWDLDHPDGFHIYPAMAKLNPQFIVPTGDTVYLDSESPRARTVELARYHWHRMYALPRLIEFHRRVPGYWEVDDHDVFVDDCWPTKNAPWMNPLTFEDGKRIYLEQVPMGETTYRTVRWGRGLQVWMVEGRFYRSPNNAPDGPDKLIWGREQRAWLKRTILESDADFKVLISPTPIVGPDRPRGKADNHANDAFATAGNHFRNWTKETGLTNLFVCCGDRHWQYVSIDPATGLHEFSCGPASNEHAGGSPGRDPVMQPFHREQGGFLSVSVSRRSDRPATIAFRHHDVHGDVVNEFTARSSR